jgi:phage/plasmid-like protein (TIGR03299 family)
MAYAGELPWHGLGKPVPNDLTPRQMLKAAGLDWNVEKVPAYINLPTQIDGEIIPLSHPIPHCALVRNTDQKILDIVTSNWNPLQNEEAFDFFKDFVMKGDMEMHTAGSLKGGQLVWALARVKESFFVGRKKDEVQSHLLFTNPHQFGKAIDIRFTPVRVVCWNTLSLALGAKGITVDQQVVKSTHRQPFNAERVMLTLGLAHELLEQYKDAATFIAKKRFTDPTLNDYFRELFPKNGGNKDEESISRNHQQALGVINTMPGADMEPGTWWQSFNAVTYMTDHVMGRSVETRLDSAWFGSNRSLKSKALNLAVQYAKAS